MKKLTLLISLFTISAITLTSCQKGDTGTTGPAGANGATGPAGPTGANGANGANGNANVVAETATIVSTAWLWNASGNTIYADITDNSITADIVTSGMVSVFQQAGSGYIALPYSYVNTSVTNDWGFNYSLNTVEITYQRSDIANINPGGPFTYKIVAITSTLRKKNPNTNWKDYNQVMAAVSAQAATNE